jgi:hypothetical protein
MDMLSFSVLMPMIAIRWKSAIVLNLYTVKVGVLVNALFLLLHNSTLAILSLESSQHDLSPYPDIP